MSPDDQLVQSAIHEAHEASIAAIEASQQNEFDHFRSRPKEQARQLRERHSEVINTAHQESSRPLEAWRQLMEAAVSHAIVQVRADTEARLSQLEAENQRLHDQPVDVTVNTRTADTEDLAGTEGDPEGIVSGERQETITAAALHVQHRSMNGAQKMAVVASMKSLLVANEFECLLDLTNRSGVKLSGVFKAIEQDMDLRTMWEKLRSGRYGTLGSCIADLGLLVANMKSLYRMEHLMVRRAFELEARFAGIVALVKGLQDPISILPIGKRTAEAVRDRTGGASKRVKEFS
ncbi:hypothetical protein LTR86_004495 [Recurvomyces mirabilis]|nr:hypothetical protein LTR86_004495 [Recurvomyces mirabilis]